MRVITIIGPSQSGKTTLAKALTSLEGPAGKPVKVDGVGTATPFCFLDEDWAVIDMDGGTENLSHAGPTVAAADAAVLCVSADAEASDLVAPYLRLLEDSDVPSILFVNKVDAAQSRISEVAARYGGRVHLGKSFHESPKVLKQMYGNDLKEFLDLKKALDPDGILTSAAHETLVAAAAHPFVPVEAPPESFVSAQPGAPSLGDMPPLTATVAAGESIVAATRTESRGNTLWGELWDAIADELPEAGEPEAAIFGLERAGPPDASPKQYGDCRKPYE